MGGAVKSVKSLVAGLGLLALAGQAQASVLLADLNVPGSGSGLPAISYGTITVTDIDGGGVTVKVGLADNVNFVNTGGPHTPFAFNLNPTIDFQLSWIISPGSPFEAQSPAGAMPFGSFNYGIGMPDNGNGWPDSDHGPLEFTIAHISTGDFNANSKGYWFAADLGYKPGTADALTGSVAATVQAAVPEPSTWAMMILGFFGVGFIAYRRRDQTAAFRIA